MDWFRLLVLGDVGQQLDIEDLEQDVGRLRGRLRSQRNTGRTQDEALLYQFIQRLQPEICIEVARQRLKSIDAVALTLQACKRHA